MASLPSYPSGFLRDLAAVNKGLGGPKDIHKILRQISKIHSRQHIIEEPRQKGWAYNVKRHLVQTVEICRILAQGFFGKHRSYVRKQMNLPVLEKGKKPSDTRLRRLFVHSVVVAGWAHDIGKIYTPRDILTKPTFPDPDEMTILKTHPLAGFRMVPLRPINMMIRQHHENMDGSGYPDGARGDEISLGARIVKAADSLHAIVDQRIYDIVPHPLEIALEELKRCTEGMDYDRAQLRSYFKNWAYPEAFGVLEGLIRSRKISEEAKDFAEANYRRRYLERDFSQRRFYDPKVIKILIAALPKLRRVLP